MMPQAADKSRATHFVTGRYFAHIAVVSCAYFLAGRLGLATPFTSGNISPVWPAAGIALAAVLVWGYRVWPGIAVAAFFVNLLSPIPTAAAVGLAVGNTLSAVAGAFLLRRILDFQHSLSRLRDVLGLIVFAALGSTMVSASIGVAVLFATNMHPWSDVGSAWLMYWLGDAMGVLLVTPLVLTLPNLWKIRPRVHIIELAVLFLLLTVVCFLIFSDQALFAIRLHVFAFAVFPFVVWAAIRFGVSGCSLSTLLIAGIATAETAFGSGPFAQNTPFMNAVLLQVFFAVLCVSGLLVAALIVEREQLVIRPTATEGRLRLAAIVDSSEDAIIGKDMDGVVTSWNRVAERIYGYSSDEILGKPISMLTPPERADDLPEIMATIRRGETVSHYDTLRKRKNGELVEVSLTVSPIRDSTGQIVGASAIARDISERRQQEQALRNAEKLAATGRLAATISHEINNPLASLTNIFYLLEADRSLTETARAHARAAGQEIKRIAHITKQMLAFHRQSTTPVDISVAELLDAVLDLYAPRVARNAIEVRKRYESDCTTVKAFPAELRQVFANLIGNAIEAVGQHGTVQLHVFASREWNYSARPGVRVVIADNGEGISPEKRRRLFEPFFTTKGDRGTGLGLWVSCGIVEKHEGSIRVRSTTRLGQSGTCFSVFLPQQASSKAASGSDL